ncbi:COG1470 family protein [Niabella drilacis]|uniref:P pilus assembly protein, chaperone PapD n=1 Tax=Niabella drilacis (strain DSM 25811 / CCM 8410 / CCUG 62505 / LMG 26954 / E90) TaxID=1285928 RepID=A0A1G6TUJ8_NIADE|nr:hypothetical protein [Niabella drilacis]SDD32763.1 hypothetical protein SAMN04487894_10840 [Niabella drilacis]
MALLYSSRAGAQSVAITPSRIFFNSPAGQAATERIRVSNTDSGVLILNAALRDWYRDSLGNKIYSGPGSLSTSNANWIRIDPQQLILQPGETKEVTVSLQVPESAKPVTNSMLFLTQVNERKPVKGIDRSGRKVDILIRVEIGIQLYNTIPGINKKDLAFIALQDRGLNTDTTRCLAATIQNTGDIATDATLRFELTEKTSGNNIKLPPRVISMLPGASQVVFINFPAQLQQGKYQATVILDGGDGTDLKVAQKEIAYD